MVKEEEEDLDKEEGLTRTDHPLSSADWIMFLSGKVYDCRTNSLTFGAMILAVMLVCLSGTIALLGGDVLKQIASYLLVFFAFVWLIVFILHVRHVNQRMKTIEKIIKDIIYRELKTHEDILKRCEEEGVFEQEND
jgi:hypothetical protein